MRVENIKIDNFRGISSLDHDFKEKNTVLLGKNGTGKTSFIEAFRFAMTGVCPDDCIKEGSDTMSVEIQLDDGTTIARIKSRTKPSKCLVNGKATPAKNAEDLLRTITGVSGEAMKITTSGDVAVGLSPAEFGNFIMQYIPENLDFDTVCGYVPDMTTNEFDELKGLFPAMPMKFGVEKLEEVRTYLYEQRKSLNKEVEVRKARISSFVGGEPLRALSAIDYELSETIKLNGGVDIAKKAILLYNAAVTAHSDAVKYVNSLSEKIAANGATRPNKAEIDALTEKKKNANVMMINAEKMLQTIKNDLVMLQNTVASLDKPVCPLSETLICTTDKTQVKEELLDLVKSNKEGLAIQEDLISEKKKEIAEIELSEKAYRDNAMLYNTKVQLIAQCEEAKKKIPPIPEKPTVTEVKDYGAKIKELQKERDAYITYQAYKKDVAEYDAAVARYQMTATLYKKFDVKGPVMMCIVDMYMSLFADVLNKRSDELGLGISAKFIAHDGVNYFVKTKHTSEFYQYASLSRGEQLIAMFLLLDMLNSLCNTRVLMLDDLNHLDIDAFSSLVQLIDTKEVQDSYDHVILCGTDSTDFLNCLKAYHNFETVY